jgi:NRAMP (natural resistance-associated macrophage protein)-like metal ion transporter
MATTKQKKLPKGTRKGKGGLMHKSKTAKTEGEIQRSGPLERLKVYLKVLGPGLITGAADDDPSGIATYSQTGAQFGFAQLWTSLYQIPLLLAIQEACARIGAITGKGLAHVIKENNGKVIAAGVAFLVLIANTINIGADIGAIAASANLVVNVPVPILAILAALMIIGLEVFVGYKKYANILKWLGLALLAYPATALMVHEPWEQILVATLIPHVEFSFDFLFIVVGVFGTTISPYMFFWEASQEVEEEISLHIIGKEGQKPVKTRQFLRNLRIDNAIGMVYAEVIQWFIIITTATVLFSHGIKNIGTAADAAKALEPFAGSYAKDVFAIGVVGIGLLAIPVLAGSASYALSETFGWKEGLYRKLADAKGFYAVIIVATLIGLAMNFAGINPISALVFTAVFNGVAAVPLIYIIARINSSKKILGKNKGGILSRSLVWLTFAVMTIAAIAMFYTLAFPH